MTAPSNGTPVVAPARPRHDRSPHAPPARRAGTGEPTGVPAADLPWIGRRGGRRDKLCVRLPEALRDRLDGALVHLGTQPHLVPGGTATLRSLNNLIAFACHVLCSDLAAYQRRALDVAVRSRPAGAHLTEQVRAASDRTPPPRGRPGNGVGSMYRSSWKDELAAARCQLTLRIPMSLSVRLRETLTWLQAQPDDRLPADLVGVGALSDLVGLACHRLCSGIERVPASHHRIGG